jgi:peptide-methionine (S)-S-oxide reductase
MTGNHKIAVLTAALAALAATSCIAQNPEEGNKVVSNSTTQAASEPPVADDSVTELATFGAGCFWCVEAVFQQLDGVISVASGYSGGKVLNPTYQQVCSGTTGHAEVCQIRFDPQRISYDELLEVFWRTHDPTTLNRQGNDVGTQYRSVIFYHTDQQRDQAAKRKKELNEAGVWDDPIVTEISPSTTFYKAEAYHQNYFRANPGQGYCQFVIRPKVEKFRKVFKDKLKSTE